MKRLFHEGLFTGWRREDFHGLSPGHSIPSCTSFLTRTLAAEMQNQNLT
jgi:hypothetical protein